MVSRHARRRIAIRRPRAQRRRPNEHTVSEPQFDAAHAGTDAIVRPPASPPLATLRAMISPRIDRLLENVDSNYASVVVAAKRARQINSYYHNLGEGTFDEFPPPMVDTGSKNYLTIALEEVAAGKIKYQYR
jgi:DNA-directed RNA polymerase subunit omega